MSWVGHWTYPTYKALGSDLVSIPLPNFGKGTKTASGTFAWGMGATTKNGAAAGKFLDFLMSDDSVRTYTDANGAPPATKTALAASTLYGPGKQLQLLGDQLSKACGTENQINDACVSVTRPVDPRLLPSSQIRWAKPRQPSTPARTPRRPWLPPPGPSTKTSPTTTDTRNQPPAVVRPPQPRRLAGPLRTRSQRKPPS